MHASLTPKNNIRLIAISVIVLALVVVFSSVPFVPYLIGAAFGAAGGFLQLSAIRQSYARFLSADNALAVRRALASSASGKIYLVLFWVGAVVFVAVSIMLLRERFFFGWLAAYCCFVVVRDLIALPATYELERRASSPDQSTRAI
jgi:polyferredoxin